MCRALYKVRVTWHHRQMPRRAATASQHAQTEQRPHLKFLLAGWAASIAWPSKLSYQSPPPGSTTCRRADQQANSRHSPSVRCCNGCRRQVLANAAAPAAGAALLAAAGGPPQAGCSTAAPTCTSVASLSSTGATSSEGPGKQGRTGAPRQAAGLAGQAWPSGGARCAVHLPVLRTAPCPGVVSSTHAPAPTLAPPFAPHPA